ncbi:uncharacterized protein CBO05P1_011 [Clostridium botulinum B str. Osaka05]|uniref:Uncharacterized protein n=1 Tax=Clostridium botulinum B str. Osaka05 TaxID=1407017 RepID=A0A060N5C1_CLOBO|nr:hypothetical protein [Clostridium botulinum]BAO04730.1 uncharacterized protein CBO05P1_011 [Clostridium botulinum B str. Osaka05]
MFKNLKKKKEIKDFIKKNNLEYDKQWVYCYKAVNSDLSSYYFDFPYQIGKEYDSAIDSKDGRSKFFATTLEKCKKYDTNEDDYYLEDKKTKKLKRINFRYPSRNLACPDLVFLDENKYDVIKYSPCIIKVGLFKKELEVDYSDNLKSSKIKIVSITEPSRKEILEDSKYTIITGKPTESHSGAYIPYGLYRMGLHVLSGDVCLKYISQRISKEKFKEIVKEQLEKAKDKYLEEQRTEFVKNNDKFYL